MTAFQVNESIDAHYKTVGDYWGEVLTALSQGNANTARHVQKLDDFVEARLGNDLPADKNSADEAK